VGVNPSITLPYPFTTIPIFNNFQYTYILLPSHLIFYNITDALSFSFPFPLSPSSTVLQTQVPPEEVTMEKQACRPAKLQKGLGRWRPKHKQVTPKSGEKLGFQFLPQPLSA
jgi:hypothetical protein